MARVFAFIKKFAGEIVIGLVCFVIFTFVLLRVFAPKPLPSVERAGRAAAQPVKKNIFILSLCSLKYSEMSLFNRKALAVMPNLRQFVTDGNSLVFDFEVTVDLSGSSPNFLGKYAQGPKDSRFIYVNSGTYAGEHGSVWGRRAKLSLMSITAKQIVTAFENNARIEISMPGVGRDGGPSCASVKGIEWKVNGK